MKKFILFFAVFILSVNSALSVPSQEAKDAIYNQITEGYFRGIQMTVKNLPVTDETKNQLVAMYRNNFNKQDFINKTYPCFMQYTDEQISSDPKIISGCVNDYLIEYSRKQQIQMSEILAPQRTY